MLLIPKTCWLRVAGDYVFIRSVKSVFGRRIEPDVYEQDRKITFGRYGLQKVVIDADGRKKFGKFDNANPMAVEGPSAGKHVDAAKAMASNTGFVYAATKRSATR